MGEQSVKLAKNRKQIQLFEKHLLQDVRAMERMLNEGWFDDKETRIGAEQELCIIDRNYRPSPKSMEILKKADNPNFTTEFAKFNAEINLTPRPFRKSCLSDMESEILKRLEEFSRVAKTFDVEPLLIGILPTMRKFDITMENLTPLDRYFALCKAINKLRGDVYELKIRGIDELIMKHDSPLLEACNTGFQVHLQVHSKEFVHLYNIAQAITAPVMAAAVSAPILFGKRLWKETRIALFQQSVDTRTTSDHLREFSPRVTFGNKWLKKSILDIYKEDIVRYRILLSTELTEDVMQKIDSGKVPDLKALSVHNSTIYRWNRPCYGVTDGKAHLRIENRILPSGPSVVDEMANAAFWLGLMNGYRHELKDVTELMEFDTARTNFANAAQHGLDAKLTWFGGRKISAPNLILKELLPVAERGLKAADINDRDIDKYLSIIRERVESGMTGSQWMLSAYAKLRKETTSENILTIITASHLKNQKKNIPVHKWKTPRLDDGLKLDHNTLLVEEFMDRDLFTVQPNDIVSLVAEIMDWQEVRYVAVENDKGALVGLMTSRIVLRHFTGIHRIDDTPVPVKSLMNKKPVTIAPDATIKEAMDKLQKHRIGCLPVVKGKRLIGIITANSFLNITNRLLSGVKKAAGPREK